MSVLLRRFTIAACAAAFALLTAHTALAAAQTDAPAPSGTAMAKIQHGMPDAQVSEILGAPSSVNSYPTGKGWIPFYGWWGGDSYRTEWKYKGKGIIVFNNKPFSSHLKVVRVVYDPKEDGY